MAPSLMQFWLHVVIFVSVLEDVAYQNALWDTIHNDRVRDYSEDTLYVHPGRRAQVHMVSLDDIELHV